MTLRFLLSKKDPRRTDFTLERDQSSTVSRTDVPTTAPVYTSNTKHHSNPRNGSRATTTITRTDPTGERLQVGVIEWPANVHDSAEQLVVGTRSVKMTKSGLYTSPERFTAADGYVYEWQIHDARPQLVPIGTHNQTSTAHVAIFLQSQSGFWPRRKLTSSLFISPEGFHILDDIIVTFVYFESKWQDKENVRSRLGLSGSL